MLGRMCCRRESVAVAEALERDPLDELAGSAHWRSIGPRLRRSRLVLGSGPWRMDHMCEATVHDHRYLYCLTWEGMGEACGSRLQSCRLQEIDCSHFRIEHGADGR